MVKSSPTTMNKIAHFSLHTQWLFRVWLTMTCTQVREVNADTRGIMQNFYIGANQQLTSQYSTQCHADTETLYMCLRNSKKAHLKPHVRAVKEPPPRTKSHLGLCGSNFRQSEQLRQNYGCLTPGGSPKLCLCGRWSRPYLLWVVSIGVMEHWLSINWFGPCALNTSAEVRWGPPPTPYSLKRGANKTKWLVELFHF